MSFTKVLILQLVILGVVLESDLGRKKIGWFRIARPVIAAAAVVPAFFTTLPTSGNNLQLQAIGATLGIVIGLFSVTPLIVDVSYDPRFRGWLSRQRKQPGKPAAVSECGKSYAAIWIVVSAARIAFSWSSQHLFPHALGVFLVKHQLYPAALTNSLIFLAVGMDLFRSVGLVTRSSNALRRGRLEAQTVAAR
jgi:hypothetical protein